MIDTSAFASTVTAPTVPFAVTSTFASSPFTTTSATSALASTVTATSFTAVKLSTFAPSATFTVALSFNVIFDAADTDTTESAALDVTFTGVVVASSSNFDFVDANINVYGGTFTSDTWNQFKK